MADTQGFPEDYYSGAYDQVDKGDPNDAASFAALEHSGLPTNALVDGCSFDVDFTTSPPTLDVDTGTVRVVDTNVKGVQSTWDHGAFVYDVVPTGTVDLTNGDVNHVFVEGDLSNNDTATITVNTTGDSPSGPSVKIGEVDTSNDTKSEQWYLLALDGTLTFPDETAANAAASNLSNGTVVYDRAASKHFGVVAGSLKTLSPWTDDDGDGTYTLPADADGAEVGTLSAADGTFTSSITDPTGTTFTDLSALQKVTYRQSSDPSSPTEGETWYDTDTGIYRIYADLGSGADWHPIPPVQVLEEASTFAESDVTVTHNNTTITNGSVALGSGSGVWVDDWEDGDLSGWTGDTGALTNQTATVLSGSRTGELTADNALNSVTSPSVGASTSDAGFRLRADGFTGDSSDSITIEVYDSTDSRIVNIKVNDSTQNITVNGSDTGEDLSVDTTRSLELVWDFANDEVEVIIDGGNVGTYAFDLSNSASDWDYVSWVNDTNSGGGTRNVYLDDIVITNGNALVSWASGAPTYIEAWVDAGYHITPDGETVTVDVEDSNGNVLESDIGQGYPLDTDPDVSASDDIRLRVNLSRNDTSNNPTCDHLYRRFTR